MSIETERELRQLRTAIGRIALRVYALEARASLPVIATCGACKWLGHPHDSDWCLHPGANAAADYEAPPPAWCPLRVVT